MSGYRQSSYDPNAGYVEPRPLKPYDKWQWLSVAAIGLAAFLMLADLLFDFADGWMRLPGIDWSSGAFVTLCIGGLLTMKYRREPTEDEPHPETNERRRLIGGLAFIAVGVAIVVYNILEFQGA
jgi:hypothetical protein